MVDFKRPVGTEISQLNFSSGPFWTHKVKPKAKYISISNILHLLSAPVSIPHVGTVLASLVVDSASNGKFSFVSGFCLIVDSCFHPSRALTRSFASFITLTWMKFCLINQSQVLHMPLSCSGASESIIQHFHSLM